MIICICSSPKQTVALSYYLSLMMFLHNYHESDDELFFYLLRITMRVACPFFSGELLMIFSSTH